ncbi:hypothetical protein Taro_021593 [Colocasia esculenta]|uniref:WW domain-containing protein n=1 Tax=Colocasia esculenta TaxID=4460 RepID=A0A843URW6_COLES|nr:hypothetical protein [Colocasia esculenta]
MAGPNIDVILASLRSCSLADAEAAKLRRPSAGRTPASKGVSGDAADIALELNSDLALPCHWEQFLDLKQTGRLYYINRSTGARTTEDPRKFAGSRGGYDSGEDEDDDDEGDDADDEDEPDDDEDDGSSEGAATAAQSDDSSIGICSTISPSSSSASSREEAMEREEAPVLVAAGCRACMMYVMIPKGAEECPRCRGHVICFGRSGSR